MTINTVRAADRTLIERYVALMQVGAGGLDELLGLFTDDAVYVEPFSGQPTAHSGRAEIRAFFQHAFDTDLRGADLSGALFLTRFQIGAAMAGAHLSADASGALRHDGVKETDDVHPLLQHPGGKLLG